MPVWFLMTCKRVKKDYYFETRRINHTRRTAIFLSLSVKNHAVIGFVGSAIMTKIPNTIVSGPRMRYKIYSQCQHGMDLPSPVLQTHLPSSVLAASKCTPGDSIRNRINKKSACSASSPPDTCTQRLLLSSPVLPDKNSENGRHAGFEDSEEDTIYR